MGDFIDTALTFPAVLFSLLLLVVVGYWALVLFGATDSDMLDADSGPDADADAGGFAGFLAGIGLGGVPVTVVLSLLIAVAWFVSLVGTVLLDRAGLAAPVLVALSLVVVAVALVLAWLGARVVLLPLRRLLPDQPAASRNDFVGSLCVIRTGRVSADFGQAEVTASDGSSAIIQVRQAIVENRPTGPDAAEHKRTGPDAAGNTPISLDADALRAGSSALIYDYDADGEFFWVMPVDGALDPNHPIHGQRDH